MKGIGVSDTPQSFTFDNYTGLLYVAAITRTVSGSSNPSFTQHAQNGDITISQYDLSSRTLLSSMDLQGCGHATSIAAVPNTSTGVPDMWFEFNSQDGYGTCVSHYPYTPTDPASWYESAIPDSTLRSHLHSPFPNTTANTPSYDPINNRMAIRYYSTSGQVRFAVFTMSQIAGSYPYSSLANVALPSALLSNSSRGGQGWAIYGDYIYLLDGPQAANNCGSHYSTSPDSIIAKFNVNTSAYEYQGTAAFSTTGRREPEGMAIQVTSNGSLRLCLGIAGLIPGSGNTTYPNCSNILGLNIAYRDVLTSAAS